MTTPEHCTASGSFSTAAWPPEQRLRAWQRFVRETFVDVRVQPCGASPFDSSADYGALGDLRLGVVRTQQSQVDHTADGETAVDCYMLHLQERGLCRHEQGGHQAVLGRGQVSLSDMARPYRLDVSDDNRMLLAVLPGAKLRARLPHAADIVCHAGTRAARPVALLAASLRALVAQQHLAPAASAADDLLEDILIDLVAAGFSDVKPLAEAHGVRRRRVQAFLAQHLCDPALRLGGVARTLGLSERQVQRAFAEVGTTFSLYLLEQRLLAAQAQLRRAGPGASITRIALDCGFNDLTYFGRAFRRRFGVAPRDARGTAT